MLSPPQKAAPCREESELNFMTPINFLMLSTEHHHRLYNKATNHGCKKSQVNVNCYEDNLSHIDHWRSEGKTLKSQCEGLFDFPQPINLRRQANWQTSTDKHNHSILYNNRNNKRNVHSFNFHSAKDCCTCWIKIVS